MAMSNDTTITKRKLSLLASDVEKAEQWLLDNQDKLVLKEESRKDEIPF